MLPVQQVGLEILGDSPGKFYILSGNEYKVKDTYVNKLAEHYGDKVEGYSMKEVVNLLSKKTIIPLDPAVYVIRYDDEFVSSLNETVAKQIEDLNFKGTIIFIHDNPKQLSKLEKFLSNHLTVIEGLDPNIIFKHLAKAYSNLDQTTMKNIVAVCPDYSRADMICSSLSLLDKQVLLDKETISNIFGCKTDSTEKQIKLGIAAKNFKYMISVIDRFAESEDRVFYIILQTMIDLDKTKDTQFYSKSEYNKYMELWTREDIYYMFMHTYRELKLSRTSSNANIYNRLLYLVGCLVYKRIPSLEVMEYDS